MAAAREIVLDNLDGEPDEHTLTVHMFSDRRVCATLVGGQVPLEDPLVSSLVVGDMICRPMNHDPARAILSITEKTA